MKAPGVITIITASTLEDLAVATGIDPDGLTAEIGRFNARLGATRLR